MQINHCCSLWEMRYLWFSKDNYWVSQWHMFQGHTVLFNAPRLSVNSHLCCGAFCLLEQAFQCKKKFVIKKKKNSHAYDSLSLSLWLHGSSSLFLSRTQQKHSIVRPQFFLNSPSASIKRPERLPLRLDRPGEEIKHRRHLVNFKTGHDARASDRK